MKGDEFEREKKKINENLVKSKFAKLNKTIHIEVNIAI